MCLSKYFMCTLYELILILCCIILIKTLWTVHFHSFPVECPVDISSILPTLPSNMNCLVTSSCTKIECCLDVAKFDSRPVNFYIFLDNCDWMISYGIDNFVAKPVVLLDFTFDEWHEFWMKGVFRIRFVKSGVIFEGLLHGTLEV